MSFLNLLDLKDDWWQKPNQKHKKAEIKTKSQHSITQSGHTKDSNITLSVWNLSLAASCTYLLMCFYVGMLLSSQGWKECKPRKALKALCIGEVESLNGHSESQGDQERQGVGATEKYSKDGEVNNQADINREGRMLEESQRERETGREKEKERLTEHPK